MDYLEGLVLQNQVLKEGLQKEGKRFKNLLTLDNKLGIKKL
jgi:hypothetical protein